MTRVPGRVEAVWRIEGPRVVATLARMTGDVGLAEDLAQDAVLAALEQWPRTGVPRRPGAWLTTVAKRRAIDGWRRAGGLDERYRLIAEEMARGGEGGPDGSADEPIDDDLLRLVFIACHPALAPGAQVALTLRVVGGLSTREIARMLLVPQSTAQQRIVRAKRTLAEAQAPFETPAEADWPGRLGAVLAVAHLIFTEGYAATEGERWLRPELAAEALRLGRVLAGLLPREPEVLGLLALMELQAARFPARVDGRGEPVLLADQDRAKWDRAQILRGTAALAQADALDRGRGSYCLQAAIAECHAVAPSVEDTDWGRIVELYTALGALAPSPIVELNRAVALSQASGAAAALEIVDALAARGELRGSHLLPSVRGELLSRLGRVDEARAELTAAAGLAGNARVRKVLLDKAERLGPG